MKNPLKYLKHIVKDPINTVAEADARKKEIMPLLYGSVGVMAVSVILQIAVELDFMAIFSFIGLLGAAFCGFLLMVVNKAKARFGALTCDHCNTLAEIKTPEDFAKYVSYTVEKDEAIYKGYTGNKEPANGVYTQVKISASSSAVLSVKLTCRNCGAVKTLKYSTTPFRCHIEKRNVPARDYAVIRASMEELVRSVVDDYNDPDKKESIPYTFHSSKNPNFENRYKFKGSNGTDAHPDYKGVRIDYHKDAEEIFAHYFVFNELTGTLVDPDAALKKDLKSPPNIESASSQNDSNTEQKQAASDHAVDSETDKPPMAEPASKGNEDAVVPVAVKCEAIPRKAETVVRDGEEEQKPARSSEREKSNKRISIIVSICAVLIVAGMVIGFGIANRNGDNDDGTDIPPESTPQENGTDASPDTTAKINVNDYVGYWHIKDDQEKELTIHSGNSDSVNLSLRYSEQTKINNVSAPLQENVASFSLAIDGAVIKGSVTFLEGKITVCVTQSTLSAMPVDELEFSELCMSSSVPSEKDEGEVENGGTDENAPSDPTNTPEQEVPPMHEVPYLFRTGNDSYGIYEAPSYGSAYVKALKKGAYTIVSEEYDENNNLWGKLKSGSGWICVVDISGE